MFGWTIPILSVATVMAVFIWLGFTGWPGLHWDSNYFATPVLNVAMGRGWVFGAFTENLVARDSVAYASHGVMHILVYGSLLGCSTWAKFLLWSGIVNAMTFVVWACLYAGEWRRAGWILSWKSLLAGVMAGVIAIGLQGRPEHLAPLLIALVLLARRYVGIGKYSRLLLYGLPGLLLTLSPASGILGAMGVIYLISVQRQRADYAGLFRDLLIAGSLSLALAWLIVTCCCPFSFLTWIRPLPSFATNALDFSKHLFLFSPQDVLGISMEAPLWNILVLATVLTITLFLLLTKRWVGLVLIVPAMAYCFPRLTDYGYVAFFPPICLFALRKSRSPALRAFPRLGVFVSPLVIILCSVYGLVFLRTILLAVVSAKNGASMAAARDRLAGLGALQWHDLPIATAYNSLTRPSFIVFGDATERYITAYAMRQPGESGSVINEYERKFQRSVEYFIYPQSFPGTAPDVIYVAGKQFELIYNGWSPESPRLLGINLRGKMPGYLFALYRKTPFPS